jgi:hypothetical protein
MGWVDRAAPEGIVYAHGFLAPLERRNDWQSAEATGDRMPDGVQGLLAWTPMRGHFGARRFYDYLALLEPRHRAQSDVGYC